MYFRQRAFSTSAVVSALNSRSKCRVLQTNIPLATVRVRSIENGGKTMVTDDTKLYVVI